MSACQPPARPPERHPALVIVEDPGRGHEPQDSGGDPPPSEDLPPRATRGATQSPSPRSPAPPAPGPCAEDRALDARERDVAVQDAVRRVVATFEAGEHREALQWLSRADCIERRPEHRYMRGAILRHMGACADAIGAFEAFLATGPPPADAAAARQMIVDCQERRPR
ncbi:MAG: hypothetical protein AAF721_14660 [Myxococcota bacterium]